MKEQEGVQLDTQKIMVGEWETTIGPKITLSKEQADPYFTRLFRSYTASYAPQAGYEYYFYEKFGLPSPIIRVDMPLITGRLSSGQGFYEVEARPAGLGLDCMLFPQHQEVFRSQVSALSSTLGRKLAVKMFPYYQNPRNDPSGEKMEFAKRMGIDFFGVGEDPSDIDQYFYFVYGNSGDKKSLSQYEDRSLFPVRDDGNKDYLVDMGVAQIADIVSVSRKLNLGAAFALKPRKGMWSQDVMISKGATKIRDMQGFSPTESVRDLIESGNIDAYVLQGLISPGQIELEGEEYYAMARVYAYADLATGTYNAANGIYIARQNIKLHGTSDAITGELVFE